jgi:hypothetical protein
LGYPAVVDDSEMRPTAADDTEAVVDARRPAGET